VPRPEIALTPQIVGRFVERFGDTVAVLHSKLSKGERYDEWQRLRRGEARICVGPRSAVFAPIVDLGLIVVDEEHDASYKHEGDPRYDARHVAERRGATLVVGTATPRPESFHALRRIGLPQRVDGAHLPPVGVLDMLEVGSALHPDTAEALHASDKAIVLLNRRGWSNFLTCRSCAHVWMCPDCDVSLVLHRGRTCSPATTAATASACPRAARHAGRSASPATARAPSASSTSSPRPACRSGAWTPTSSGPPTSCAPSSRRRAACSSARRWSPRATTSRT
jgi:primosomal protein N' (replication factor Y)